MKDSEPTPQESEHINYKNEKLLKYDARGVQTLFRNLSRNHYSLLKMVDNKARIMLTVSSLMASLLLGTSTIIPSEMDQTMKFGTHILILSNLLSMIFAILSMLPYKYLGNDFKKSSYKGTLYAENFAALSIEEFKGELNRIMLNGQNIYDEMILDLYFLGKTIAKKQALLIISFLILLIGIVITIIYSLVKNGGLFF